MTPILPFVVSMKIWI